MFNYGSSIYDIKVSDGFGDIASAATVCANPCKHKNGWYHDVSFGIFTKKIFACGDCGVILEGKRLKEFGRA